MIPWRGSAHEANNAPTALGSLQSGDGGGTFDDMEARVKRLEEDWREIKSGLQGLSVSLAKIEGGMEKFATKGDLTSMSAEIGGLKGQIQSLPSTTTLLGLITLVAVVGGIILGVAHYWGIVIWIPTKS